jgi:hypothetical protein
VNYLSKVIKDMEQNVKGYEQRSQRFEKECPIS